MEKAVSSVFILTEDYGTRSSALLMLDKNGEVQFSERTYLPGTTVVTNIEEYNFTPPKGQFQRL